MNEEKAFIRKGNKVWSKTTSYSGRVIFEDENHILIDYLFSPHSRIGYRSYWIDKENIEVRE